MIFFFLLSPGNKLLLADLPSFFTSCLLCPVRISFLPFFLFRVKENRLVGFFGRLFYFFQWEDFHQQQQVGLGSVHRLLWIQFQYRRFYSWGVRSSDSPSFNSSSLSPESDPISCLVWSFHEEKARNELDSFSENVSRGSALFCWV